jgi:fatty-acyl-CoA synthase
MPAYGLAEATLCVTATGWKEGLQTDWIEPGPLEEHGRAVPCAPGAGGKALVRLGLPMRGTSVRITDRQTGQPIADRLVGHVEVRGPAVVGHYWGEAPPESGSWLRTGDLGYLADGQVVVCGREKDVLFAAGRNVYPQDVEAVALEVPGVRAGGAAAFAVSSLDSERLVVAVEARAGDAVQVRHTVAEAVLNEVGLAADVVVVPYGGLPKTSSGKLRRAEARRRYMAQEMKVLTPSRVTEMEKS